LKFDHTSLGRGATIQTNQGRGARRNRLTTPSPCFRVALLAARLTWVRMTMTTRGAKTGRTAIVRQHGRLDCAAKHTSTSWRAPTRVCNPRLRCSNSGWQSRAADWYTRAKHTPGQWRRLCGSGSSSRPCVSPPSHPTTLPRPIRWTCNPSHPYRRRHKHCPRWRSCHHRHHRRRLRPLVALFPLPWPFSQLVPMHVLFF
jgi:hypothetical protein